MLGACRLPFPRDAHSNALFYYENVKNSNGFSTDGLRITYGKTWRCEVGPCHQGQVTDSEYRSPGNDVTPVTDRSFTQHTYTQTNIIISPNPTVLSFFSAAIRHFAI